MIDMLALEIVFLAVLIACSEHSLAANEIKAARLGIA
jgi:hypothetical protein